MLYNRFTNAVVLALFVHVMQVNALEILDDYHENEKPSSYDISFLAEPALSLIFSNETINILRDISNDMGLYSNLRDAGPEIRESVINKLVTTEGLEKTRLRSKFNNMLLWIPTKQDYCAWHNGLRIKLESDCSARFLSLDFPGDFYAFLPLASEFVSGHATRS